MQKIKLSVLLLIILNLFNCNKIEKIKNDMNPGRPYKQAGIDRFYWEASGYDYVVLPLLKPYKLMKLQGDEEWILNTSVIPDEISDLAPTLYLGIKDTYIYGFKPHVSSEKDPEFDMPEKWFIIDTKNHKIAFFKTKEEFKNELQKLQLTQIFLDPDKIYESYKDDPVLPWFPEKIKNQLEEIKKKLK